MAEAVTAQHVTSMYRKDAGHLCIGDGAANHAPQAKPGPPAFVSQVESEHSPGHSLMYCLCCLHALRTEHVCGPEPDGRAHNI